MTFMSIKASPGNIYALMKSYVRARKRAETLRFKLTKPMIHYMTAVERDGSKAWVAGNVARKGGAVSRMWDRLVAAGLATPPPHKLTAAGRTALRAAAAYPHQRITPAAIQRMSNEHHRSRR